MARAAVALILVAACGSAPPPPAHASAPPASAAALPPLPRSSIAAVLLHRDELGLSDEQVHSLQEIDEELAEANAKVVAPPVEKKKDAPPPSAPMGKGHARGARTRMAAPPPERHGASAEQRTEDNDTRAYLRAEQVLTDAQREKARDIAEDYRAKLYDRRHPEEAP